MWSGLAIGALAGGALVALAFGKLRPRSIWTWLQGLGTQLAHALLPLGALGLTAAGVWLLVKLAKDDGEHLEAWAEGIAVTSLMGSTIILAALGRASSSADTATTPLAVDESPPSPPSRRQQPPSERSAPPGGGYVRALIVGKDGRWSTSKVGALLWTYAILFALITLFTASELGLQIANDSDAKVGGFGDIDFRPEYLLLLGGPFAAAVLAKGITTQKVEDGTVTKPEVPAEDSNAVTGLRDLISNDSERTDLVDFQYLMFTLVALVFFLVAFVPDPVNGLPVVPEFLVGLTSASALAYVTKKAVERSVPTIVRVVPSRSAVGEEIEITGRYLAPAGSETPVVEVGGRRAELLDTPVTHGDETVLRVEVPDGAQVGEAVEVSARPRGAASAATATIAVVALHITEVVPETLALREGAQLVAKGTGFGTTAGRLELGEIGLHVVTWTDAQVVATIVTPPPPPPPGVKLGLVLTRHSPDSGEVPDAQRTTFLLSVDPAKPAIESTDPAQPELVEGTPIVVNGHGFGEATDTVKLGPLDLVPKDWSDTRIIANVPAAGPGVSAETLPAGQVTLSVIVKNSTVATRMVDVKRMTIGDVVPQVVPNAPGTVRIPGAGFGRRTDGTGVTLDNRPLEIDGWSDTLITARLAQGIAGLSAEAELRVRHALGHSGTAKVRTKG